MPLSLGLSFGQSKACARVGGQSERPNALRGGTPDAAYILSAKRRRALTVVNRNFGRYFFPLNADLT